MSTIPLNDDEANIAHTALEAFLTEFGYAVESLSPFGGLVRDAIKLHDKIADQMGFGVWEG